MLTYNYLIEGAILSLNERLLMLPLDMGHHQLTFIFATKLAPGRFKDGGELKEHESRHHDTACRWRFEAIKENVMLFLVA